MLQDDGLKERLSALYALIDWIKNGTMLREHALSPFAKELALGVCRRHLRLQHAIKKNVHRMPSVEVQCVLEMGIYQIFFMNVPSHAAVDSSAELARRASLGEGSVKLVNGVCCAVSNERAYLHFRRRTCNESALNIPFRNGLSVGCSTATDLPMQKNLQRKRSNVRASGFA